jgi:hypothetical protein
MINVDVKKLEPPAHQPLNQSTWAVHLGQQCWVVLQDLVNPEEA